MHFADVQFSCCEFKWICFCHLKTLSCPLHSVDTAPLCSYRKFNMIVCIRVSIPPALSYTHSRLVVIPTPPANLFCHGHEKPNSVDNSQSVFGLFTLFNTVFFPHLDTLFSPCSHIPHLADFPLNLHSFSLSYLCWILFSQSLSLYFCLNTLVYWMCLPLQFWLLLWLHFLKASLTDLFHSKHIRIVDSLISSRHLINDQLFNEVFFWAPYLKCNKQPTYNLPVHLRVSNILFYLLFSSHFSSRTETCLFCFLCPQTLENVSHVDSTQ